MEMLGLYPTWLEPMVGSGWIVGIISTIHVLASHTSVGAALVFAYLAVVAYRQNRPELLDYIKKYGLFLLVFSYVIGSITGPGIWFSATVASPRGISALIHSFVWKWATEWVFFVIEVVGVYLVVYLVGKVDQKTHMRIAVIFGLASYTTMLIIIGILSFMMWPGKEVWFTEGGYLNGFYGSNTFAQLAMRTAFMFTMTAVVGGIVASGIKELQFRKDMLRRLGILGIVSTLSGLALFQWYLQTLPEYAHIVMENRLPEYFQPALIAVMMGITGYFLFTLVMPRLIVPAIAGVMTVTILVFGLWPEEVARESIRKPFVAGQYVYSNQVIARDVPGMGIQSEIPLLEEKGFLKTHVFLPDELREVTPDNVLPVGKALAMTACSNCHSLTETGIRPLASYFGGNTDVGDIKTYLLGALATGNTLYMPQIPLTDAEAEALAVYIASLEDPQVAANYTAERKPLAKAEIKEAH
ncbi:MAG: cytochrome c [Thiothrix sp.]